MLLKPLTVATFVAATVSGFLIPPEITEADIQIVDSIDPATLKASEDRVIQIDCPGCPVVFGGRHGPPRVKNDKPNHLELSFTIDHQAESDRLLLNGFELYPNPDPFHGILTAPQVLDRRAARRSLEPRHFRDAEWRKHRDGHHHHRRPVVQPLGFSLHVSGPIDDPASSMKLVNIDLDIIEVGPVFIDSIPSVRVTLVTLPKGKLLIGDIKTTEQTPTEAPAEKVEGCDTMLCRFVTALKEEVKSFKPKCHGNKASAAVPPKETHGHFREGPRELSWAKLFENIASHILLPVLIGIVAGVSVSLIGMAVGTLIVSLWRLFFRRPSHHSHRRRRSGSAHKARKEAAVVEEEKASLVEYQDAPPSYEADEAARKVDV